MQSRGSARPRLAIHNFGRADDVDADKLRRLAKSILRVFSDEAGIGAELDDDMVLNEIARRALVDEVRKRGAPKGTEAFLRAALVLA